MHMTTALGLLDQMLQVQPKNNMLFLFQPAEENEAGGMLMYEDGAFGDWLPDEFYGCLLYTSTIACKKACASRKSSIAYRVWCE